jgi:hypothetical protein
MQADEQLCKMFRVLSLERLLRETAHTNMLVSSDRELSFC